MWIDISKVSETKQQLNIHLYSHKINQFTNLFMCSKKFVKLPLTLCC